MRLEKGLKALAVRRPCRVIDGPDGEPYLERYALLVLGPDANPWFSLYLHRFVASDPDRGLHDHPWTWSVSLVLSGGYDELRLNRPPKPRRALSFHGFGSCYWHRVVLPEGIAECWTLFAHGRRCKGWGFFAKVLDEGDHEIWTYHPYARTAENPTPGWWRRAPRGDEASCRPR